VPYEISPEPEGDAREALELALDSLHADAGRPPAERSRWRSLGVSENVEVEQDDYATARPRSKPGATRA
jgi:hypothetical protein